MTKTKIKMTEIEAEYDLKFKKTFIEPNSNSVDKVNNEFLKSDNSVWT